MSTIVRPATPLAADGRKTVAEFEGFIEDTDERFELIDGQLIRKPSLDPPHVWSTQKLKLSLERMVPERWFVRDDKPVKFSENDQPDPDIAVIRGDEDIYCLVAGLCTVENASSASGLAVRSVASSMP